MENLQVRGQDVGSRVKKPGLINLYPIGIHAVFILVSLACVIPMALIVSISLSNENDVVRDGYSFLPKNLSFVAYQNIFANPSQLQRSYIVTILVTVLGAVLGTLLVTSLAYVISRKDYKYRNHISFFVFFTMLFNGGLVPSYILIAKWLHMKNTIFALFVPALFNAFYVLLMKGFLRSVPDSLFESAKLDGAKELAIFVKIALPLAKPGVATIALFYALQFWNDWFLCSFYIDSNQYLTLQTMLIRVLRFLEFLNSAAGKQINPGGNIQYPTLTARMAMCVLAAGPMLFVFPFFQKYFVKGITIGSIKG